MAGFIPFERQRPRHGAHNLRRPGIGLVLEADGVATGQGGVRWYPASVRAVLVAQAPGRHAQPVGC